MKKSTLFMGPPRSGKTTTIDKLLSKEHTDFVLDCTQSVEKIKAIQEAAEKANSYCLVATQMKKEEIPSELLSKFEVVQCEYDPKYKI